MIIDKLLLQIEDCIMSGHFDDATKLISKLKRKKSLNTLEKIKISTWYHWMGKSNLALKMLGPVPEIKQFSANDNENIVIKIRIAHMLNYFGARKSAVKIINQVQRQIKDENINIIKIYPQYYNTLGNFYLQQFEYEKGLDAFCSFVSISNEFSSQEFFNVLGQADCLCGLGKYKQAISLSKTLENRIKNYNNLQAIYFQAIGEYHLKASRLDVASECFMKSERLFRLEKNQTKDYAYLKILVGIINCLQKKRALAKKNWEVAKIIMMNQRTHPTPLLTIMAYREFFISTVTLNEKIANRLYPLSVRESSLIIVSDNKKNFKPSISSLLKSLGIAHPLDNKFHDCYYISHLDICGIDYIKCEKILKKDRLLIDLYSGVIIRNGKIEKVLSSLDVKSIHALVGGADIGIYEYMLLDLVYDDSYYDFNSAIEKVHKLLLRLKKLGLKISKTDGIVKLENARDFTYLIPPFNHNHNRVNYLKVMMPEFCRKDVEKIFNVSKSTALSWILDWRDSGLIRNINPSNNKFQVC